MNTIILFGASRGGENFIKNHQEHYHIIAVVDNDVNKQGKSIHDIPIIAATEIQSYVYDYIIVASMYVHSIAEQLKSMGVHEGEIKYASKNSMKVIAYPFKNEKIIERANRIIAVLSNILKDVRHFYTFGTLLGIVRDSQLIPWDDDIDIAIFSEDAMAVKQILLQNTKDIDEILQTKMYDRYYPTGEIASICIDCYYLNELVFNVNFDCIYVKEDIAKQELNETPLSFFEKVENISFNNHHIFVPQHYEQYLQYTYGDWRVVKENTSFFDNTLSFIEPSSSCTSELFYDGVTEEKRT